jgi:hypothetical protein
MTVAAKAAAVLRGFAHRPLPAPVGEEPTNRQGRQEAGPVDVQTAARCAPQRRAKNRSKIPNQRWRHRAAVATQRRGPPSRRDRAEPSGAMKPKTEYPTRRFSFHPQVDSSSGLPPPSCGTRPSPRRTVGIADPRDRRSRCSSLNSVLRRRDYIRQ